MWKPRSKLSFVLFIIYNILVIDLISCSHDWPAPVTINNNDNNYKTMGILAAHNQPLQTLTLDNTTPVIDSSRYISLLGATGSIGEGDPQSLQCNIGVPLVTNYLQGNAPTPVPINIFSLTLLPLGSIPSGLISISLQLDSAGTFSITTPTGASVGGTVSFQGSLSDINAALSTLVYTPAIGFTGDAEIKVGLSGYNIVSSSCSVIINVSILSPLMVQVDLLSIPEELSNGVSGGLVIDLSSVTGELADRFKIVSCNVNQDKSQITCTFEILPVVGGPARRLLLSASSPTDIFNALTSLTSSDVGNTQYLKYADLNSWRRECSDGSFALNCTSGIFTFLGFSGWILYCILAAFGVAFILLIVSMVYCVKKCHQRAEAKHEAKQNDINNKDNTKNNNLSVAAIGAAKQYIYTPPTADNIGEFSSSDPKSINFISEVAIQEKSTSIDPTREKLNEDELISEPVLVGEDEKAAAEFAKSKLEQSKSEHSANSSNNKHNNSLSSKPKYSGINGSTGSTRHFYYIDDNKSNESSNNSSNSNTSILAQREESRRNSLGSQAHFKYTDDNDNIQSRSRSNSQPVINLNNTLTNSNNLPILPSTPVSKQCEGFKSTGSLDLSKSNNNKQPSEHNSRATTNATDSASHSDNNSRNTSSSSSSSPLNMVKSAENIVNNTNKIKEKKSPLKVVKPNTNAANNAIQ